MKIMLFRKYGITNKSVFILFCPIKNRVKIDLIIKMNI